VNWEISVPPYKISDKIVNLISSITEMIVEVKFTTNLNSNPRLRKDNRIKTIHNSLAIENNPLSIEQVTAIINGKRILGNPKDIREVENAYEAYDKILNFDPTSVDDFLLAHKSLMNDLINNKEEGNFRDGAVGVFDQQTGEVIHMAPSSKMVPELVINLFKWLKETDAHPLIKSSVFHYELEFIHPFADGNGRMGRMWQTLILSNWQDVFSYLPIESLIRERQIEYYKVLRECDSEGESSKFIEYILLIILDSLVEAKEHKVTDNDIIQILKGKYPDLKENYIAVISLIYKDEHITNKELAVKINKSDRTVARMIKVLKDKNIIERVGSKKNGKWVVNF